jgi:hypothetical protein
MVHTMTNQLKYFKRGGASWPSLMYVGEGAGHMMMSTHSEEIEEVIENFFQKTVAYIDFIRESK